MELTEAWRAFKERALAVPIDEVARRFSVKLKSGGGDLIGHCPAGCTTHGDGFIVTAKKRIFLCRPSGETGDVIDMVRHAFSWDNKDGFAEACEFITGEQRPKAGQTDEEQLRLDSEKRAQRIKAMREGLERHRRAETAKKRGAEQALADLMARAVAIEGTQAEAYLKARGVAPLRRLTVDLKFVAEVDYWGFGESAEEYFAKTPSVDPDGKLQAQPKIYLTTAPAMLGLIRDAGGGVTSAHVTYLSPDGAPRKLAPPGDSERNGAKKFRGSPKGGLIRLGQLTDRVVIGEGIETTLAWASLSVTLDDSLSFACAGSLANLYGKCTRSRSHPTQRLNGKPVWVPNGVPDMDEPGCVLPDDVVEVTLLGDADSERIATRLKLLAAGRRFRAQGRRVYVHYCVYGADWADVALARTTAGRLEAAG